MDSSTETIEIPNNENVREELKELKEENLIEDYDIEYKMAGNIKKIEKISLTLLEGKTLRVTLNEVYCYKLEETGKIYETFESLLSENSKKYIDSFMNRLNKISQ